MKLIKIRCLFCDKEFFRPAGRINEANKFGWKQYCSLKCISLARIKEVALKCANSSCGKIFKRPPHEVSHSRVHFCSRSCANRVIGTRKRKIKICVFCGKKFWGDKKKYYSAFCRLKASRIPKITKEQIIKKIKEFFKKEGRIPFKEEFPHYNTAQIRFGSWNKAIETAGFEPNPVVFSKKFIAEDGHKCDSFAEKIIDDWFYERKIEHKKEVPYPENRLLSADFAIGNNLIEYFGLSGVISKYDELIKEKQKLCKKYKLPLIEIYPKDLFPRNRLPEIFFRNRFELSLEYPKKTKIPLRAGFLVALPSF